MSLGGRGYKVATQVTSNDNQRHRQFRNQIALILQSRFVHRSNETIFPSEECREAFVTSTPSEEEDMRRHQTTTASSRKQHRETREMNHGDISSYRLNSRQCN